MEDEKQDLRDGIMEKFNLTKVGENAPSTTPNRPIMKPNTNPHLRSDSVQGLAQHEEDIRKQRMVEAEEVKPEKTKTPVDESLASRDSMDLLAEVMEKKKGEVDDSSTIRENANKFCIDDDLLGHMFGL